MFLPSGIAFQIASGTFRDPRNTQMSPDVTSDIQWHFDEIQKILNFLKILQLPIQKQPLAIVFWPGNHLKRCALTRAFDICA